MTEVGGSAAGLTFVMHDLSTSLQPPNLEDCTRNKGQLQGLEPSRMAETANEHNPGAAGEADAI